MRRRVKMHSGGNGFTGFTLIELMVVIAILGIIVAIALPSYEAQMRKSRRADAQTALLERTQELERWYTNNNTFVGYVLTQDSRLSGHYTLAFGTGDNATTATYYQLNATPVPGSSQASDSCETMSITSTGAKSASASGCWR